MTSAIGPTRAIPALLTMMSKAAQRRRGVVDRGEHLIAVADICDECRCFAADFGDLVGDGVDAVRVDVDQCDVGAVAGQPQRDTAADTAPAAGDQGDFVR